MNSRMLIKLSLNRIRLREVLVSQRLTVKMKVLLGSLSIQMATTQKVMTRR